MRIAFMGKGGSGKTSLATATALALKPHYKHVLAIDADLNAHLGHYLGLPNPVNPLGEHFDDVAHYLFGSRSATIYPKIGTIPPSQQSRFIRISPDDHFIRTYATVHQNMFYLSSGTYQATDLGDSCFHAKLNTLELALHHLLDTSQDLVIIDAAAGVDSVATSMHFAADITFFVIEPSEKSVSVYKDYLAILKQKHSKYPPVIILIFNKVEDERDIAYLSKAISKQSNTIIFPLDRYLVRFEQGDTTALATFISRHQKNFDTMHRLVSKHKRNYRQYLNQLIETFNDECNSWANDTFNSDFSVLIDPDFTYEGAIERYV